MKEVVITGGNGFIGSRLTETLQDEYHVRQFDRTLHRLHDPLSMRELIEGSDLVFHLAGIVKGVESDIVHINAEGTRGIVDAVLEFAPQARLIFASSFAVYKPPQQGDIIYEQFPLEPRNCYGVTKLEAERTIIKSAEYGLKYQILRLSNVYGLGIPPHKHSVISTFIDLIKKREKIVIYGDGTQTRDYVNVSDVTNALLLAAEADVDCQIANICTGEEVSINEIVELIGQKLEINPIIEFQPLGDGGGFWRGNPEKAQKVFGWISKISLNKGINQILETNEYWNTNS